MINEGNLQSIHLFSEQSASSLHILFTFLFVSLFESALPFWPSNAPFSFPLLSLFILFFPHFSAVCRISAIRSWFICNLLLRIINLASSRGANAHILKLMAHITCSAYPHECEASRVARGLKKTCLTLTHIPSNKLPFKKPCTFNKHLNIKLCKWVGTRVHVSTAHHPKAWKNTPPLCCNNPPDHPQLPIYVQTAIH